MKEPSVNRSLRSDGKGKGSNGGTNYVDFKGILWRRRRMAPFLDNN